MLALYDDCELFQSMRLQVKSRCKLALTMFPMDIQSCEICVESCEFIQPKLNTSLTIMYKIKISIAVPTIENGKKLCFRVFLE